MVNTKTVRKLVRPRPLHESDSIHETRCALKPDVCPPHLTGQAEIPLPKNPKCVRKLSRPRPLRVCNSGPSNAPSQDSDEGTCTPLSSTPSEVTPANTATSRATPEWGILHAFETIFAAIKAPADDELAFRRIADACSLLKTRGPVMGRTEQLDKYFDKLRDVACHGELRASVRLMLLEVIERRSWEWNVPESVEKFYRKYITAPNLLDSISGEATSSAQTAVPQPATGPVKQMAAKGAFKKNAPPGFPGDVEVGHWNRNFRDDVTTEELAAVDNCDTPDGCGSGHTRATAVGRDSKGTGKDLAETATFQ